MPCPWFRRVCILFVAGALGLVGGVVRGEDPAPAARFRVPLMARPPRIDGTLAPGEWDLAAGFEGMSWGGKLEERTVRSFVGATATDFYLAIESELPAGDGKLVAGVFKNIPKVVYDDAFEVWIDAAPGQERGRVFQMLGNSLGKAAYQVHVRGGAPEWPGWHGNYEIRHGLTATRWVTEIRLPVRAISATRKTTDGAWGIALCRDWKQPWMFSSAPGDFRGSDTRFVFARNATLAVRFLHDSDPFTRVLNGNLVLRNPGPSPVSVKARIELERNSMPTILRERVLTLAAGAAETVPFMHREDNSDAFGLGVRVVSADGETIHYQRTVRWGKPRARRWETTRLSVRPVDFQFSHYPYRRELRIRADLSGLAKEARLESLTFVVRERGALEPVARLRFASFGEDDTREQSVILPELDGVYEIVMTAAGKGVPPEPLVKTFVRKRYEWEHTSLGRSDKVYPPFTPLELEGRTLRTVLREHALGDLGLWRQVEATGKELLAAPMRFSATASGKEIPVRAAPLEVVVEKADVVKTRSRLTAGPLSAEIFGTWDYDGTLKVDLDLLPSGGQAIDSLTLHIPLVDRLAPMMHAMKEGIRRGPVSVTLPKGDGVIWDSSELPEGDMPNNFCSYIFLGTALRGLCWFAENDLNWSWDRETPAVDLVRKDGILTLRVHLINRSTVITQPRRITFGLLAAPVKPRPRDWRTFWYDERCTLLGTCINWLGGPGNASNIYPPAKDPYFWKMIARANVEKVPREDIQACIERGRPYFEPWGKGEPWERHVRYNVGGSRFGKWMVFYYNRATFSACEEYATFINEWGLADYPPHDFKPSIAEIKLIPSESYCDFALHWYAKSFESGRNRGVYWDNWYLRPSFNRVMTAAYRDDGGEVIPATGIWGLRELSRRTFVMMHEKGMRAVTMPHMTSTNILPMHSFATVQYDWEWKYSTGDLQYRHSREYLQLVSNGELAGVIPVLLGEHGKQAKDEWVQRTYCGVALVHELMGNGYGKVWRTLRDPIVAMSHDPALKVWRYWDGDLQPVTCGDRDLPVIVYSIPGKEARVVLCSYDEQDRKAVPVRISPRALGFGGSVKVVDAESGQVYPVDNDTIRLDVAKHAVIGLHITAEALR